MRFAEEGRWVPAQMKMDQMGQQVEQKLTDYFIQQYTQLMLAGQYEQAAQLMEQLEGLQQQLGENQLSTINKPDTSTLKYAQFGIRFTTTIGPADIGAQYYYGRLTRPAVIISTSTIPLIPMPIPTAVDFAYNPYHQIGFDFAQVLYGFNVRAELAANITSDLKGDDGGVYNSHLALSLGFDHDLVQGSNLNMQLNESIRFMNSKINNNKLFDVIPQDTEADTDMTATQIIAIFSRTFLKGQLEARAAFFWELEAKDIMFVPSLVWTKDALSVELSCGIFGGDKDGQFGQYRDNSFIKTVLKYSF
jgi:hypothetical protein